MVPHLLLLCAGILFLCSRRPGDERFSPSSTRNERAEEAKAEELAAAEAMHQVGQEGQRPWEGTTL